MKKLIIFLVLFCISFSVYYDPPIETVISQNGIYASGLMDSFNGSASKTDSIYFGWYGRSVGFNSSMRIAGFTLLVDDSVGAGENSRVVIEKGEDMQHILMKYSDTIYCDRHHFETYGDEALCDFDGDGCSEYEYSADVFYTMHVTFIFRDLVEIAAAPEETVGVFGVTFENALTNTVTIPDAIEKAMVNASGNENLTVIFNGTATVVYGIDNRTSGGPSCISRYSVASKSINFGEEKNYPVEGKHKLVFTTSPLLNEQWFRSNRFDNLVLSQSRIYKAKILMDGELEEEFSLYVFNITENSFGLKEIVSIPYNDSSNFVGVVDVNPYQLDESNQTYAFLYEFNYSYEGMLGEKELRLDIKDFYGNEKTTTQEITSRQLSYDSNKTETRSVYDPETTRKSASYGTESLKLVEIGLGMVGVILIVLLMYHARK